MRNRERMMIETAEEHLDSAMDLVSAVLESRYEEDDGVAYDLRVLYARIHDLVEDARDISYDL